MKELKTGTVVIPVNRKEQLIEKRNTEMTAFHIHRKSGFVYLIKIYIVYSFFSYENY